MFERDKNDLFQVTFDAMPSLVFIVDDDVRIQEYNTAASYLLSAKRKTIVKQRAGDVLHCIHSNDVPEGCGRAPFCETCIIRNSVEKAFEGKKVARRRTRIEVYRDGIKNEIYALITTSPFTFQGKSLAILIIEDISEIAELRRMIPICCSCNKVRDYTDSWSRIESYFKQHWDVDFSHSICPECYQTELDKINNELC
jgi:PAS domain-containing protein